MQLVTLAMLAAVVLAPFLVSEGYLPGNLKFLPEMLSGVVAIYVIVQGISTRFKYVRSEYWVVFGAAATIILCGIIANSVGPGPILSGMRYYARAIPFFFLPMVYQYKEAEIQQQLKLLGAVALLQLPLAAYQKYTLVQDMRFTGDFVYGTLMLSSSLTVYMIMGIAFLIALFLRDRLTKQQFGMLFLLYVVPTTLNETKITVFFMPLAIITTAIIASPRGQKMRILTASLAMVVVAGAIFVPIYNYLGTQAVRTKEEESSIYEMFTKKDYFQKYLNQNTAVGDRKEVGRVDAFTVPLDYVSRDPVSLAFGLGLGNASNSNIGPQFSGKFAPLLSRYASGGSSAGSMVLEVGVLGGLCALLLHWLIFRDCMIVARQRGPTLVDILAPAWPASVILTTIGLFYVAPIASENMSYLFWYFSGVFVARRMQLALESSATARARQSAAGRFQQPLAQGQMRQRG